MKTCRETFSPPRFSTTRSGMTGDARSSTLGAMSFRVLKENRTLVLRCKELEIKLDSKVIQQHAAIHPLVPQDGHCSRLQEKVTKDAAHIHSLATVIDKLRTDIGGLQNTIDAVKNTQVKDKILTITLSPGKGEVRV